MKKTSNNRPQVNVTMPEDVYERLCKESDALGITRSAYVTMSLKQKWQQEELANNLPSVMQAMVDVMNRAERLEKNKKAPK